MIINIRLRFNFILDTFVDNIDFNNIYFSYFQPFSNQPKLRKMDECYALRKIEGQFKECKNLCNQRVYPIMMRSVYIFCEI